MWKLRGKYVAKLIKTLEDEGAIIDIKDEAMLVAYVRGDASDTDLIAHFSQFQNLSDYQKWLQLVCDRNAESKRSSISVEQVIREVSAHLHRKYAVVYIENSIEPGHHLNASGVLEKFHLGAKMEIGPSPC
jgi:hypothetical protein